MNQPQATWLPDPTGRHEYRWWDGHGWTDVVADQGVETTDPMAMATHLQPQGHEAHQPYQAHQPPGGQHRGGASEPGAPRPRSTPSTTVLGVVALALIVLVVAVAVVVTARGGGDDDDDQIATVAPRDALITIDDMPTGWAASDVGGAPGPNKVCEPRLEPPEPPREAEANFDRTSPSGALVHSIVETTPQFAADYINDALRQADDCGTFTDEFEAGGQTYSFTATSEVVNGPTLGDQTVWYLIHSEYREPAPSSHDVVVCIDRHGGVISEIVLSTSPPPMSEADRAMVEDLLRIASERLQGDPPA